MNYYLFALFVCIVLLVQERIFYNYKITNDLALSLLEFIIRFGINNTRFQIASESLYNTLSVAQKKKIFGKILIHFDTIRPALSVIFVHNNDLVLKVAFNDFIC